MEPDHLTIIADSPRSRAVRAVADLLTKQRLDFAFLGGVAASAWLDERFDSGPVDVLAVLNAEQKNQICMMASHRGFRVDRAEVEAADELDLIPLHFDSAGAEVRVHVLVASNALYAHMVTAAVPASLDDLTVKVAATEDYALLLAISDSDVARSQRQQLLAHPEFDLNVFNSRMAMIGLGELVVPS